MTKKDSGQQAGNTCPICNKRSYSPAGIHPQCAVYQADSARAEKLKADRKKEASLSKPSTWTKKKCPKCGNEAHVRRKACDCGHKF